MTIASERLQGIRAFLQTAEAGSFTGAARQLGQSKSTIAKAVGRLEARLRTRLFLRTTRSLSLTDEGRLFRESCLRALAELERAEAGLEARLADRAADPVGRLRIAMPVLFGRECVMPILLALMERHRGLELEALFSNRPTHLIEDRIDLAVRIGALPDTLGLTTRRCGTQRSVTCAAPAYLDRRGMPEDLDALAAHDCIGILRDRRVEPWRFAVGGRLMQVPVRARIRVGHVEAALLAARAGLGLVQVPLWLAQPLLGEGHLGEGHPGQGHLGQGRLRPVLAAREPPGLPIHLVWPTDSLMTARLRLAIDALAAGLPALPNRPG
ncbi:DNA-binding transcriptional LysR family regulator [Methylobacterium brachiatum]|uniref:DNA-binding transcriptional LysR family regulator n=1 Tax=Methylobacterium brachiatum TaxID=269660 RepID=A0AAJ1TVC5_9HYPH|nr:LysR family transcriptional regulator [Methylobacterium brachiatum]MCB4804464.1 LysR family transcriptional regulator [Methylobacterium brachiatum]MDQ0545494.1 DNA-binding transcriptional LysR family regulator [Methylobacterium brachiatum]